MERKQTRSDGGAALIIALIFMIALGLVLGSIATYARGSVTNAINLKNQRTSELQASSAVAAAMQNVRRSYYSPIYTPAGTPCLYPNGTDGTLPANPFHVWCTGSIAPGSQVSRTVNFYACPSTSSCAASGSVFLFAKGQFNDIPPGATPINYSNCNSTGTSTCGIQMRVAAWDYKTADT